MNENSGKNPKREEPFLPGMSDLRAAMKNTSNGPRFLPADLHNDPQAAHDALLHWDVQSEQTLRLLAEHPEHGGRLDTLQRADGWLRQRAARTIVSRTQNGDYGPGPDFSTCPPADELYAFAAGPGASPLTAPRRSVIDRHLATCRACEGFAATLAVAPPAALLLGLDEAEIGAPAVRWDPTDEKGGRPAVRPHRLRLVLVPLAVAAAVVLAVGAWRAFTPAGMRPTWPEAPLLRGETADALLWPRGRVLERSAEVDRLVPALAGAIPFEFRGPEGSEGARLQLYRTAGGAFDLSDLVEEWVPISAASPIPAAIPAGHYTWKAWTRERGLDVELGSRDFEVVADDALLRELADLLAGGTDEAGVEEAGVRAVALLDARGYRTDARVLARSLPASAGRDAYLGRTPGR